MSTASSTGFCVISPNRNSCSTAKGQSPRIWITGCWMYSWPMVSSVPIRWPSGSPNWSSAWNSRMWCRPTPEFFQAIKRKESLKKLLKADDTAGQIRLKMLAVCTGSEPRMDAVVENLLQELADGRDEKIKLIGRCSLDGFLREQMTRCYGYKSDEPGIRDFAIELFKSCYAMGTDGLVKLTGDALVFLKRWKDSRQFEGGFETLSGRMRRGPWY